MADIVLKDYSGKNELVYNDVTKLRFIDEDGNIQYYSKGSYAIDELPQLYAPTSMDGSLGTQLTTGRKYLFVYLPNKNGGFPEKLQMISNNGSEVYGEYTLSNTYQSPIAVYADAFNDSYKGNLLLNGFKLVGEKFTDSDILQNSSLIIGLSGITYNLSNVVLSQEPSIEYATSNLKFTLTPDEGYYLPKILPLSYTDIYDNVYDVSSYTYTPDDNSLQLEIPLAKEIRIPIHATQTYWLRNPQLSIENPILYVDWQDWKTETTNIICDDKILVSIADDREGMVNYKAHGYTSISDTENSTYQLSPTLTNTATIATLTFYMKTAGQVQLYIYCNSYSADNDIYNCTVVSKVDCSLSYSEYKNEHDNVLYTTYNHNNGQYYTTILTIDIPEGEHTIDVAHNARTTYNYQLGYTRFRVETSIPKTSYDFSYLLPTDNYETYSLSAQSVADGCDPSDIVEVGSISNNPVIDITDGILTITNTVPEIVTAFELYIDDVLTNTVAYDSTTEDWSIDLTEYSNDTVSHDVYVKGIGDGVNENQSNIVVYPKIPYCSVETVSGATYGFTLNSSGYYQSGNKGKNNSYAICKVVFNTQGSHLYLDCINYAENNYDFGILSNIDKELTLSNTVDSTNVFKSFKGYSSSSVQTVDYGVIASGEHFIYVKFRKDSSGAAGNDTLQFKVRFE